MCNIHSHPQRYVKVVNITHTSTTQKPERQLINSTQPRERYDERVLKTEEDIFNVVWHTHSVQIKQNKSYSTYIHIYLPQEKELYSYAVAFDPCNTPIRGPWLVEEGYLIPTNRCVPEKHQGIPCEWAFMLRTYMSYVRPMVQKGLHSIH